ncbi:acyl-CoA dehydrogenase family protein [Caballeronia sp. LZ001]|uniref:acyl-CoA dehydrogenase family protein n=1 Tax=Caballeronia sp. LZ001 TaxID=3038553 RepID=UPI002863B54B|nr:acyl-CoA dehydrogenase family protein [Caballeronia sp. LZ001]MDR5804849.1 acyl-CoA/acyl-ACP dehydrogenase [Caballeronia sp. LZ001]
MSMGATQYIQDLENDEIRMVRDSAQKFTASRTDHLRTRALRELTPGYDARLLAEMAELGWLAITIPEEHGGLNLGFGALGTVLEETSRGLLSEPLTRAALAARLVALGQNEEAAAEMLPAIASGEAIASLAWQESASGDDLLRIGDCLTRAEDTGSAYRLSGCKRFVDFPADGGFIVTASDGVGIGLFAVDANAPGVVVESHRRADGVTQCTLVLNQAPARHFLARGETAMSSLEQALDEAAVMTCAELCGIMGFVLETTLEFMRTRVQFDRPIGSFQALQHRAVDLYIQRELAVAAYGDALEAIATTASVAERRLAVSRAKSRCASAATRIALDAIQLHGAIGFTDEHDLGLYLKRTITLAAQFGTADAHQQRCQQALFSQN